jgi:hypothetical protein
MHLQDKLYSTREIAEILGVATQSAYARIKVRDVEPIIVEGIAYYTKEDVEKILKKKRRGRPTKNVIQ